MHPAAPSYNSFVQEFVSNVNFMHTRFLILIEVKAEHVTGFQIKVVHIAQNLLFTLFISALTMPDLQLNEVLVTCIERSPSESGSMPGIRKKGQTRSYTFPEKITLKLSPSF